MKILSLRSTCREQMEQRLKAAGRVFIWDEAESLDQIDDQKYDAVVIGPGEDSQIESDTTEALKVTATLILIENCPKSLLQKMKQEWSVTKAGRSAALLLQFGKKVPESLLQLTYPCGYRGEEPVRTVGCKPCQTLTGKTSVEIFHCSLFNCECSLASREMPGKGKLRKQPSPHGDRYRTVAACTTCKERKP